MPVSLTVAENFQEEKRNAILRLRSEWYFKSLIWRYTNKAARYLGCAKLIMLSPADSYSD